LQQYLTEKGIETLIHYPIPPHKQQAMKAYNSLSFPITEKIHDEVLSLPISPVLTDNEVDEIINAINQF
jgi:dTDP-4-amino-4,6-dideoxygalactose transaminase